MAYFIIMAYSSMASIMASASYHGKNTLKNSMAAIDMATTMKSVAWRQSEKIQQK